MLFTLLSALFFSLFMFTNAMAQWSIRGADIDGEAALDWSGYSVSMPGSNTVAIGAYFNNGNGSESGHVRVYAWNGSAWAQKGNDIDGEAANDRSGVSVSMPDNNTLAIGAILNDGNGNNAGHVRIYAWNGSAWVQKGSYIDGEAAIDLSGGSVSMPDSNTVAIGAYLNDGSASAAGHVRVYAWNGSAWVQKGSDIDGEAANDGSGYSVSMPDSNIVAIGAHGNDGNGESAGHVRVYAWNGSAWAQKGSDIDGEQALDWSGSSVSMPDSNTVAIGAHLNDGIMATEVGHVRVWYCSTDVSVTDNSPTLIANATGATYQWLDCNNSFAVIGGETNQAFTATTNGDYAVEVTQNGCMDTSACYTVSTIGIPENSFGGQLQLYPNPTTGQFTVSSRQGAKVQVYDLFGRKVLETTEQEIDMSSYPAGLYIWRVGEARGKLVIE